MGSKDKVVMRPTVAGGRDDLHAGSGIGGTEVEWARKVAYTEQGKRGGLGKYSKSLERQKKGAGKAGNATECSPPSYVHRVKKCGFVKRSEEKSEKSWGGVAVGG